MKTILDYADLVKEQHALNTTIAPVETDLTSASQAYAVGQKFVYDGVLYQAKTAIAQGAALVLNTNYEAADNLATEIQTLANLRAELGAHNLSLPIVAPSSPVFDVTVTVNSDGVVTLDGTATNSGGRTSLKSKAFTLKAGTYKLSKNASDSSIAIRVCIQDEPNRTSRIAETDSDKNDVEFTLANDTLISIAINVSNGVVYSNGFNIKPMITLISDTSNEFAPYAMTNRELTEVVQHIEGKYVVVAVNKSIQVTADGVKTVKELLNDLASAYIAMAQALADGEATSVTGVNVYVPTASGASAIPSITTFSRALNTNSNTSSLNVIFRGVLLNTTTLIVANVKVNSTLSICEINGYDLLNNTSAFNDSDTVVPNDMNMTLYYSLYQKVQ